MSFGENLKNARKAAGLTQKELAQVIGAKHNSISNWEHNQNRPDPDSIQRICDALKISSNVLFGQEERSGLSHRDQQDIARDMEALLQQLESGESLMFDGDPMCPEAIESMKSAMKLGLEAAKLKNKERFTPKQYKKDEDK